MAKDVMTVRVEPAVRAALEKAADADDRTVSWLVAKILADWARREGFLKK